MSQAGKVAEIFTLAGETFMKLGTLAMSLQQSSDKIQDGGKWGDEEVEMLKKAISQFGEDIEKISTVIRTKSASQIKAALKQKTVQNLTTAKGRPQLPISIQPRHAGMKSKANIVYSHEVIPDESGKKAKVETSNLMSSRQSSMSVLSPSNCTEEQIRSHFDDYGKIVDVRIFAAKNYAFIKFDTHANAATAICKSNGTELVGSCLKCWWGKDGGPEASHGSSGYTNHSSSHYSSSAASYQQSMQDQSQYAQMTPQQQQQYMQYMQYHPYYQQQYYHYWMQQYQAQMQQSGGQQAYQQQQTYPQQTYPQQQQTYPQQNYQS